MWVSISILDSEIFGMQFPPMLLKAYDELKIRVPKGRKADIEAHAKTKVESVNGLVNALLRADMGVSEGDWKKGVEE